MLTNSPGSKRKASKSSKDLADTENDNGSNQKIPVYDKGGDGDRDSSDDYFSDLRTNALPSKVYLSRERADTRPKSRHRSRDEFQMPQGTSADRRGGAHGFRGRGGGFSRRVERENDSNSTPRSKFQESLKGSTSDVTLSSSSKFTYYADVDARKLRLDHNIYNVPEDSRISKLLRRLSKEEEIEKFLSLCTQLQDSLSASENARYIRRAFDEISSTIMGTFHRGPGSEAKAQASKCLGLVGYVLIEQDDFKRYMDWIFTQYESERNEIRLLLLQAMLETVRLDKESPNLKESNALTAQLQTTLENTDYAELVMGTVDVIALVTESYQNSFTKHFRDAVDILVGWHIDGSQSPKVLYYASRSLQKLNRFWIGDIQFTVNLLAQFLEDMEAYGDDFTQANSGKSTPTDGSPVPESFVVKISALIKVFNTVAKSMGQHLSPTVSPLVSWSFLTDSFVKMLRTVTKTLELAMDQDLIVTANECSMILLTHLASKVSPANQLLYKLVDIELELASSSSIGDATVTSMLQVIVKTVREVSGNLPMEFVQSLLAPTSPILLLRFSAAIRIQNEILSIYLSLLNLKNIQLLQEVYRHVLGDLDRAYRQIVPSIRELCAVNPYQDIDYDAEDAEMTVMFYLRALTDLANATNSIIGMWALNPSILELLAKDLKPYDNRLGTVLQYSLLYLLHSHCSKSNNFVSSSQFVSTNRDRANVCNMFGLPSNLGPEAKSLSPTSGHFVTIIDLLTRLISSETCEEVRVLVLTWSREVFLHAEPFFASLYKVKEVEDLVDAVLAAGHDLSKVVVSRVGENVEQLLSTKGVHWSRRRLETVVGICLLHFHSSSVGIRNQMSRILAMVPWDVTVSSVYNTLESYAILKRDHTAVTFQSLSSVSRYHIAREPYGAIQAQHFRRFMGYLLQGANGNCDWLREVFCSCWPLQASGVPDRKNAALFGSLALASTSVLLLWATWEAAQLCIMLKLRTPLGKPQDTFTSIEGAVKQLAREIGQEGRKPETRASETKNEPNRVRLLLDFVEHLEKAMYNAGEGCATTMLQPPKPIRTFFHTNKSTCAEWLTRIRMAVVAVAVRSGQATVAVRHGHYLLQGFVDNGTTHGADFQLAVMYVGWALCKLGEAAAILGLYSWSREVSGRKFPWLKAAAHQAAGKYELAVEDYRKILEQSSPRASPEHNDNDVSGGNANAKPSKTDVDPQIIGFLSDQLAECYRCLLSWSDLHKWKVKETEMWSNQNGGAPQKYLLNTISADHAKALAEFEEKDFATACELMKWPAENELPNVTHNWNGYKLVAQTNAALTNVAMHLAAGKDDSGETVKWRHVLETCSRVSHGYLQDSIKNHPSEFFHEALVMKYAALGLQNLIDGKKDRQEVFSVNEATKFEGMNTSLLTKVLWWGECFEQLAVSRNENIALSSSQLRLEVIKAARKEGNLGLAQKLMLKYLETNENLIHGGKRKLSLEDIASNAMKFNICSETEPTWDLQKVKAYTEIGKLLFALENVDKAVDICVFTSLSVSQTLNKDSDAVLVERSARLLVTLSKWLQEKKQGSGEIDVDNWLFVKLVDQEKAKNNFVTFNVDDGPVSVPSAEVAIGQVLQLACGRCPQLAKTWGHYATWCYRWGKRMVETPYASSQLTDVDKSSVQQMMPRGTTIEELETVTSILSRTRSFSHEEDIEGEDINTSEMIKSQLSTVRTLETASEATLDSLVAVWRKAQKRIFSYYQQAATAYFKYLAFCDDKGTNDCNTIMATLRLLRMIVKHAMELQDVLETGLGATPTRPWKVIIPQLFSRLSHPEPYVRTRVSELLCRVAEDAPHLITFPAVVGAVEGGSRLREITSVSTSRLFSAGLSQPEDEDDEEEDDEEEECLNNDQDVSVLKSCFLAMVDTLSKQAPLAISQVKLVVSELHRITLLWDELWLGTLVQHHAEISRRLSQLEGEVYRVEDNMSLGPAEKEALIAEKYRIIMKPLVFILEQLHAITSVPPETPHEVWFQEKFNDYITDALQKLKSPHNPRKPHDCWHPLKVLQSRLQQRAAKRAAYAIHMSDISPALAALRDTVIAMPGVTPSPGKIITIASVGNAITVLPTKTKPKKLVFHGNDGLTYTYLFKGLEDLHLDERIMQFLSIANTMLASDRCGDGAVYQARHYSVIPLGPRSGLISWVDGVTPLFGLYKRWQQREVAAGSLKGTGAGNQSSSGVQVMRPSEMFYNKLTPLLKEKGITNLDNRKEWPLPILQQVLTELMDETPKDLLAKELWCHSVNAGDWWRTTRRYSYSVAVMSIIGYIIGLGDRHLDNVLVDLNTGEVVHIDYNVCFEKGKTLRVPEKVPFRMTQNIRTALGVTGVEGIFRLTCEHVLKVMKKGRETLLTLLEAFVYDPLIDWTPGGETGYTGAVYGGGRGDRVATGTTQTRRELEREVTRAMFDVRVAEMRADWLGNRDSVVDAVGQLDSKLVAWLAVGDQVKAAEEALQDCHQQMALVKEAEAQGHLSQHPLYSLHGRYAKHRRAKDALAGVRAALADRVDDTEKMLGQHAAAIAAVRGPQLPAWINDLNHPIGKDSHLVFDLVKEFLQNAGQGPMVGQCEHSETELGQLEQQQRLLTRTCLDLLTQYKAVAGLYPASYINTHRAVCYRRWALYLLNNMNVESCHEVRAQFASLFSPDHPSSAMTTQQVITCSFQQQAILNDANMRLQKWYERLAMEGSPDVVARVDAAYLEAKGAISVFPRSEKGAALALECVNVTALCALNKRYIMMETAAFCAGDSLVDLTSRDGDWFLDEMYVVSTSITELAWHIPAYHGTASTCADSRVPLVLRCIQSAHGIYKGLQELNFNFHMIILPEAVERIQAEEPTVLAMVASLNETIASAGTPLNELLGQLEMHLRCVVMEMESPHSSGQATVAQLRSRFKELTRPVDSGSQDRPGMMLLMGFNGLFEKLQKDGNALVAALDTLETPACWKKIDQVRDAKALSAPVFNDATRAILEDIFLIRRLQTMQEFFGLCCQMALNTTIVHDDERLMKPIRRYTADFVSRRLLGVTSQTLAIALCLLLQRIGLNVSVEVEQRDVGAESKVSLEELCRKAVDVCLKTGSFTNAVLAQASGLTSGLEATWRRKEGARRLQQEVEARQSTLKRLHYQLTAYHWLHEDSLSMQGQAMHAMVLINRPSFMLDMRQTCSALLSLQPRITEALKQQAALVTSVEQRLKWAAGANPALMEVLAAFESALAARGARLAKEQRVAADVGQVCTVLLHHEALRTRTSEGVGNDNAFLQLIRQCENSCLLAAGYDQSVTPVEESLVQLLPPEGSVDNDWLQNVEMLISGTVKSLQQQIVSLQDSVGDAQSDVRSTVATVHSLINTHHKLIADIKNLIKPMLKYEDGDMPGLQDYWSKYRSYADDFSALIRDLCSEHRDLDVPSAHRALAQLRQLRAGTGWIYQELLALGKPAPGKLAPAIGEEVRRRPPLLRQESVCLSPRKGVPDGKKATRDPHTGKAMQERNAYAVSVWRRVRTKFEGRDPDLGRKVSNQEQVDYVIREATSLDNLSLLYEGWTPWV